MQFWMFIVKDFCWKVFKSSQENKLKLAKIRRNKLKTKLKVKKKNKNKNKINWKKQNKAQNSWN